jgi:hypothetical protein
MTRARPKGSLDCGRRDSTCDSGYFKFLMELRHIASGTSHNNLKTSTMCASCWTVSTVKMALMGHIQVAVILLLHTLAMVLLLFLFSMFISTFSFLSPHAQIFLLYLSIKGGDIGILECLAPTSEASPPPVPPFVDNARANCRDMLGPAAVCPYEIS